MVSFSNCFTSTFNSLAIVSRVSRSGCLLFVHQLETVTVDLFNYSAGHLPVLPFSTNTTLILFNFSMRIDFYVQRNIIIFYIINEICLININNTYIFVFFYRSVNPALQNNILLNSVYSVEKPFCYLSILIIIIRV